MVINLGVWTEFDLSPVGVKGLQLYITLRYHGAL